MTNTINTRVTENQNSELHNNLEECRYVDCSEFESSYNKLVGISALHLNISSLFIDSLGNMLEQLAHDFNAIAISETRITQDAIPHNLEIPNYKCVSAKTEAAAGGTAIYIHKNLTCKIRPDL